KARGEVQLGCRVADGTGGLTLVEQLVREGYGVAHRATASLVVVNAGGVLDRDRLRGIEDGDVLEHTTLKPAGIVVGQIPVVDARRGDVHTQPQPVVQRVMGGGEPSLNPLQSVGNRHSLLLHVVG